VFIPDIAIRIRLKPDNPEPNEASRKGAKHTKEKNEKILVLFAKDLIGNCLKCSVSQGEN
jgi:uncharacterized protein (UPF0254 family)